LNPGVVPNFTTPLLQPSAHCEVGFSLFVLDVLSVLMFTSYAPSMKKMMNRL